MHVQGADKGQSQAVIFAGTSRRLSKNQTFCQSSPLTPSKTQGPRARGSQRGPKGH